MWAVLMGEMEVLRLQAHGSGCGELLGREPLRSARVLAGEGGQLMARMP